MLSENMSCPLLEAPHPAQRVLRLAHTSCVLIRQWPLPAHWLPVEPADLRPILGQPTIVPSPASSFLKSTTHQQS